MLFNKNIAEKRAKLLQKTRDFFNKKNFLEVETAILTPTHDPAETLTPFETKFISQENKKTPLYLNTSPELQMKKLLGANLKNIYTITKVFRNGELGGGRHNPEFTMLEWYRENADYKKIMEDSENLIIFLNNNSQKLNYQNFKINLKKPWPRISIHELFLKECKIDLLKNKDFKTFAKTAQKKGHSIQACKNWDDIFYKIFLNEIEPNLGKIQPVFVYDYPSSQAALAKKKKENPFWAERFELYIAGHELCNAYSELTDANEQRKRFESQNKTRKKLGKTVFHIDEDFLAGLESITQPVSGNALGLDRLFMVLLNQKNIEDVILFPLEKMLNN